MRTRVAVLALSAFAAFAAAPTGAGATELVGPPVKVASGPLNKIQAVITPDNHGGFAAFSMLNDDDDVFNDKLYAQFFGSDRKPIGETMRFGKKKIKKEKVVGAFLNGGAYLGTGAIIVPYILNLSSSSQPTLLAQLFKDGQTSGKSKTLLPSVSNPYPPVELRDGRALVSWDPVGGGYQEFRFATRDGEVAKKSRSFNSNYVFPIAIEGGFLTTFVSGLDTVTLKARIYNAAGDPVREFSLVSAASSGQLPKIRIVGLAGGEIALMVCERDQASGRCRITGQRFSTKGLRVGDKVVLVEDAPEQLLNATYLTDGGLLASFTEDEGGISHLVHRTFDSKLKPKGKVEESRPTGSFPGGLTTLTDGRVAARYTVNGDGTDVYVQLIAP